jgi:hypothetical protein
MQRVYFDYRGIQLLYLAGAMLVLGLAGCQPFLGNKSMNPWGKKKVDTKVVPDRILAVWTDTVLHQPGQKGIRGFGGRVYFYEKDKPDPIEVEGSLAIYAFDAEDESIESQKPLRKFAFTTEHLESHMSKTSIGPSYSIWLPWSAVGEEPRKLSLITRFEGVEGGTTISDPVIKLLPGITKKTDTQTHKTNSLLPQQEQGVVQAAYTEPKGADADKKETSRPVQTIELPPGFQRHLKNSETSETTLSFFPSDRTTEVLDSRSKQIKRNTMESQSNDTDSDATDQKSEPEFANQKAERRNLREGKWIQSPNRLEDRMRR